MSDIVDDANDRIEVEMSRLLQTKRYSAMRPAGACHYCAELLRGDRLFCDTDCRDSYDREAAIRRKQGL